MSLELPLSLQYALVAAIVALALWMFLRRQFPGAVRRCRVALAAPLVRDGRPAWMRALARRIAPPARGGCDSCGPAPKR